MIAKIISNVIVIIINYLLSKIIIFKKEINFTILTKQDRIFIR